MILVLRSDGRKGIRGLSVKSIITNSLGIVTFQVHGFWHFVYSHLVF